MKNKYTVKYILHFLICFVCSYSSLISASISFFDINTSKYPEMQAKVFFLDDKGENIQISSNKDIEINENGIIRNIISLECPSPEPPAAISAILTIDVSGSMTGNGIQIANAAAKAFINSVPLGKSEVAISSFDTRNYLNCDFTTDKKILIDAIDNLKPMGGTSFNAGLLEKMFGSLILVEKGINKKVIVFLTDGFSSGDEEKIVKTANMLGATIYCVVIGQKAPQILKNISHRTGGEYFEYIRNSEQAEKCYKDILFKAQGGDPCIVKWLSEGCPDNRKVEISLPKFQLNAYDYYSVDFNLLPALKILPTESIRFGGIEPGTYENKKIRIVNKNDAIHIDSITSSNNQFKILDFPIGGVSLMPEDFIELTIQFLPFDSAYKFSRFSLFTNACIGNFFYGSGGFYGAKSSLLVEQPNGGENLYSGIDTLINWSGIPESDTVKIELSTDGGFTWKPISQEATNLSYVFTPPNIESDKCLIRIKQLEPMGSKVNSFRVHTFTAKAISISSDSKFIATSGEERNFNIYDLQSSKLVKSISSSLIFKKIKFSPDGKYIACSMSDYSLEIYETSNWSKVKKIQGEISWIDDFVFSNDSKYIASISDNMNNRRIKITNLINNNTFYSNSTHSEIINNIISIPDALQLISSSDDGTIKMWDFATGNELKSIQTNYKLKNISISPDASRVSVISGNDFNNQMNNILIFDLLSGNLLKTISINNDQFTDLAFSPDGQSIAISTYKGFLYFYSAENYDSLRQIRLNTFIINDIEWSKDSRYLCAITNEGNLHLINFEIVLQEDISDDLFSISKAKYITQDIIFANQRAREDKDSIFVDAFKNISNFPLIVKDYKFITGDSSEFSFVSIIDTIAPNSSAKLELRFSPKEAKLYKTIFRIYLANDSIDISVRGEGYNTFFAEYNKFLDFGKVQIDHQKDTLFKVFKNTSDKSIAIKNIKINNLNFYAFKYHNNFEKIIKINEELHLPVSFLPLEKGISNTLLELYSDYEDEPIVIQLIGEGISDCGAESINKLKITELNNIQMIADAYMSDSLLILNQAKDQSLGGIRFNNYIPIDSGFYLNFKFSITNPYQFSKNEYSYPGADGISIVLHNSNEKSGNTGGGMGYTGMQNAMAIELDLFSNDKNQIEDYNDPNGNHLAVMIIPKGDSTLTSLHKNNNVKALNADIPIIKSDGTPYYIKIEYDQNKSAFLVFLDSTGLFESPVITINDFNIKDYFDLYDNKGANISIFGVSGSSYQSHKLHNIRLCTYINSLPVYSSIEFDEINDDFSFSYNPISKSLEIKSNINTNSNLSIYSGIGNLEKKYNIDFSKIQTSKIPLEFLSSGFYILKLNYGNKSVNWKFIKY